MPSQLELTVRRRRLLVTNVLQVPILALVSEAAGRLFGAEAWFGLTRGAAVAAAAGVAVIATEWNGNPRREDEELSKEQNLAAFDALAEGRGVATEDQVPVGLANAIHELALTKQGGRMTWVIAGFVLVGVAAAVRGVVETDPATIALGLGAALAALPIEAHRRARHERALATQAAIDTEFPE